MSECHISNPKLIKHSQNSKIRSDSMARFQSNQTGNFSILESLHDSICRGDKLHGVRIILDQSFDHINLFQGLLNCILELRSTTDICGPELKFEIKLKNRWRCKLSTAPVYIYRVPDTS